MTEVLSNAPAARFVMVHFHILKNGGSTIEWIFEREFGPGFATLHGSTPEAAIDAAELGVFLRKRKGLTAVSSHHFHYPLPPARGIVFFDCCFFRHPLDRLASLYSWARRGDSTDHICALARSLSARDFARRILHDLPHMVCNVQVTHLARRGEFMRPANEADLERATAIMMEMAVPGVVEAFDESLIAAEYFLHAAFPHLRLHYEPQNVTRPVERRRSGGDAALEDRLIALWGGDTYADLLRLNRLDLELWRRARAEVQRRLSLVPGLAARTADFSARCAGYGGQFSMAAAS